MVRRVCVHSRFFFALWEANMICAGRLFFKLRRRLMNTKAQHGKFHSSSEDPLSPFGVFFPTTEREWDMGLTEQNRTRLSLFRPLRRGNPHIFCAPDTVLLKVLRWLNPVSIWCFILQGNCSAGNIRHKKVCCTLNRTSQLDSDDSSATNIQRNPPQETSQTDERVSSRLVQYEARAASSNTQYL